MSENVVNFTGITRLDISVDRVLEAALKEGMSEVVITGFDADGDEYFASSQASGADVLWHLERAKHRLMTCTDDLTDPE